MSVDYTGFMAFGLEIEAEDLLGLLDSEQGAYELDEVPDGRNKPASFYYELLEKNGLDIRSMGDGSDVYVIYAKGTYHTASCGTTEAVDDSDYNAFDVNDARNKILQVLGELGYTDVERTEVSWLVGCYQW